jgi:hypothetical protein
VTDSRVVNIGVPPPATTSNGIAATPSGAPPSSVLERVRSVANAQREPLRIDIPVELPPWDGRLVVRYGTLPIDQAERFSALQDRLSDIDVSLDMMVTACRTLLWVEDGQTVDMGVRLDYSLWEYMQWPLPPGTTYQDMTAREVITKVFDDNSLALGNHLTRLSEWMARPSEAVKSPGESQAAAS